MCFNVEQYICTSGMRIYMANLYIFMARVWKYTRVSLRKREKGAGPVKSNPWVRSVGHGTRTVRGYVHFSASHECGNIQVCVNTLHLRLAFANLEYSHNEYWRIKWVSVAEKSYRSFLSLHLVFLYFSRLLNLLQWPKSRSCSRPWRTRKERSWTRCLGWSRVS